LDKKNWYRTFYKALNYKQRQAVMSCVDEIRAKVPGLTRDNGVELVVKLALFTEKQCQIEKS